MRGPFGQTTGILEKRFNKKGKKELTKHTRGSTSQKTRMVNVQNTKYLTTKEK